MEGPGYNLSINIFLIKNCMDTVTEVGSVSTIVLNPEYLVENSGGVLKHP